MLSYFRNFVAGLQVLEPYAADGVEFGETLFGADLFFYVKLRDVTAPNHCDRLRQLGWTENGGNEDFTRWVYRTNHPEEEAG